MLLANGKNNFFTENSGSLYRIFVQKMIKDRVKNSAQGGSVWSGWIGFEALVSEPLATINTSLSSLILDPAGSGPVRMAHLAPWWDQWRNINTTEATAIKISCFHSIRKKLIYIKKNCISFSHSMTIKIRWAFSYYSGEKKRQKVWHSTSEDQNKTEAQTQFLFSFFFSQIGCSCFYFS